MINCVISNSGGLLDESASALLFATAQRMARKRRKSLKFNNDRCFGVLTTEYKNQSLGTLSGIQFKAEMVANGKESVVTFLVHGDWIDDDPNTGWSEVSGRDELERRLAQDALHERPRRLN